ERAEEFAVLGPPGCRESAHGLAVEATHGRDDPRPPRRHARELERALNRLGAAVAEEHAIERGRKDPCQPVVELGAPIVVEELGARGERPGLGREGVGDGHVAVAEIGRALAADAINVLAAGIIPDQRAVAADERELALLVEARSVRALSREDVARRARSGAHAWMTVRTRGSPAALRMTTSPTPPSIASRAARIFFRIRPWASPSASSS